MSNIENRSGHRLRLVMGKHDQFLLLSLTRTFPHPNACDDKIPMSLLSPELIKS
jgi:hypothetical protein